MTKIAALSNPTRIPSVKDEGFNQFDKMMLSVISERGLKGLTKDEYLVWVDIRTRYLLGEEFPQRAMKVLSGESAITDYRVAELNVLRNFNKFLSTSNACLPSGVRRVTKKLAKAILSVHQDLRYFSFKWNGDNFTKAVVGADLTVSDKRYVVPVSRGTDGCVNGYDFEPVLTQPNGVYLCKTYKDTPNLHRRRSVYRRRFGNTNCQGDKRYQRRTCHYY